MAAHRVVGFVAMHVDGQAALGGDLAERAYRGAAVVHGAFEMRDTAHDIDTHIERADDIRGAGRRAQEAILRESDQLQVEIGFHALAHLEHRCDRVQVVGRGVDMGTDREKPHGDRPVAIVERTVDHLVHGGDFAQFAPEIDAFEQRSGGVDPGRAIAERCVHVKMRVDERGRNEIAGRVDRGACGRAVQHAYRGDGAAPDADIGDSSVGQRSAGHENVEFSHQRSPRL